MSQQTAEEWPEPLDWIEEGTPAEATSIEEIREDVVAAWSRLLARLRNATSPGSSA